MNWDERPELNITPLVDVMLVLVAILMLTTPMLLFEEQIALPRGSKQTPIGETAAIVIRIDVDKNIWVGKQKFEFNSFPDSFMLYAHSQFPTPDRPKQKILLAGDKELKYSDVVYVIKGVKAAGFTTIALATDGY